MDATAPVNIHMELSARLYITPERGWTWDTWRQKVAEAGHEIMQENEQEGWFLICQQSGPAVG